MWSWHFWSVRAFYANPSGTSAVQTRCHIALVYYLVYGHCAKFATFFACTVRLWQCTNNWGWEGMKKSGLNVVLLLMNITGIQLILTAALCTNLWHLLHYWKSLKFKQSLIMEVLFQTFVIMSEICIIIIDICKNCFYISITNLQFFCVCNGIMKLSFGIYFLKISWGFHCLNIPWVSIAVQKMWSWLT